MCMCIFQCAKQLRFFICLGCPEGYFGFNCIHQCNKKCKGCDRVDGLCNTGCLQGWAGTQCEERKYASSFFYQHF